jgi:uncharacterized SAM-binding protein YcdF (DUF218 family)
MKSFLRVAVCFLTGLAAWIAVSWVAASCLAVEKPLQSADAIFVLSGSDAYIERADEAAKLFKEKIAPKIFLTNDGLKSGWSQNEQRNPYFVERARSELIAQGVPAEAIETLPGIVEGTNDEANLLVKISVERNLKSLLLVTSAYHTRRTLWTFERVFSKNGLALNVGIKSPSNGEKRFSALDWWFSLGGWKTVGGEYVKTVYYWLVY